ncbi:hypothetical protein CPB83DRAFT_854823 [Crepidotus variabilis]|uniref:Uncharacterized protein n=1 Tax=Crepidotus variabilis TaxID=179855 RepID=A0A9P6EG36_9AGAR|nr:hypothetical protein CPB83DRAFT_854823 [Crepidotus variabilis]
MSPRMKASWCHPIPRSQLSPNENLKKWLTEIHDPAEGHSKGEKNSPEYQKAQRRWEYALENFAAIIIDSLEVDYVDAKMKAIFRKKYSEDHGMIWEEEELVL